MLAPAALQGEVDTTDRETDDHEHPEEGEEFENRRGGSR